MTSCTLSEQDLFVYNILSKKRNGTYLHIGCGDAIGDITKKSEKGSATNLLSTMHGWYGIGIDIKEDFKWGWDHIRRHPIIVDNVLGLDFNNLELPSHNMDYLCIDSGYSSLQVVWKFPFEKFKFAVITVNHHKCLTTDKLLMRDIIRKSGGYELLCSDVCVKKNNRIIPYEDWWVDLSKIDNKLLKYYKSANKLGSHIGYKEYPEIKLSLSPSDALNHLSILNIRKEYINDEDEEYDIDIQIKQLLQQCKPIFNKCLEYYTDFYICNKNIWKLKEEQKWLEVINAKHERANIKSLMDKFLNMKYKHSLSYKINLIDQGVEQMFYYVSSGPLKDFFNNLYVLYQNYIQTGKKAVLIIANIDLFYFEKSLADIYYELVSIIVSQDYISEFLLEETASSVNQIEIMNEQRYIDLIKYNYSPHYYKTDVLKLLSLEYELSEVSNIKWLSHTKVKSEYSRTILIHDNGFYKKNDYSFINEIMDKYDCRFISVNKTCEYDKFPYRDKIKLHQCDNLYDLCTMINSCKFFIGCQEYPLSIAYALGKPCLGLLEDVHYVNMENYNKHFYWLKGEEKSYNFNQIKSEFVTL
jgi:hypothetical protein